RRHRARGHATACRLHADRGGVRAIVLRNAQAPALTGVVAMRVPVQAPPTAGPSWISTLAAKVPLASAVVVPSTRSRFLAIWSSARLIEPVSVPAAGLLTTWFTIAEVLAANAALPP